MKYPIEKYFVIEAVRYEETDKGINYSSITNGWEVERFDTLEDAQEGLNKIKFNLHEGEGYTIQEGTITEDDEFLEQIKEINYETLQEVIRSINKI